MKPGDIEANRAEWIAALSNPTRYTQATGALRRADISGTPAMCCLGVACDLIAPTDWHRLGSGYAYYEHPMMHENGEYLDSQVALEYLGLTNDMQRHLSEVNDSSVGFVPVVEVIEGLKVATHQQGNELG
jgi:hypothetical protein